MKTKFHYNPNLSFVKDNVEGNTLKGKQYHFNEQNTKPEYRKILKWVTSKNPQRKEKRNDKFTPDVIYHNNFLHTTNDTITWLGHSSFFIHINGLKILTDPVFHDITPFLRRKHKAPCAITEFNNIDIILLSHGHRDHLDLPTLKKLAKQNNKTQILCPLGFESILNKAGFANIQEAAWWQQYNIPHLEIVFLPAKHWNRRFINDFNTTLWGSFSIKSPTSSIYFAGDTGYSNHFKEINQQFNGFDYCLLPIGAYKPRYIMEWAHVSPEEAVRAFQEINGKTFIPMHYGTFDLSDEPASEPLQLLNKFHSISNSNGRICVLKVGEILKM